MEKSQEGIFLNNNYESYYLELSLKNEVFEKISFLKNLEKIKKIDNQKIVFGFSQNLWNKLTHLSIDLKMATSFEKGAFSLKSTQQDLLIWLQGKNFSDILDSVEFIHKILSIHMKIELEQRGFIYHNSQDLTGFVDGTANPEGDLRQKIVCINSNEAFAGGSFAMTQKWRHNLQKFSELEVKQQENVIGRTKNTNIEFEKDVMPKGAHVERVDLKIDKKAIKIYRRSLPYFNSTKEKGLFFLAFSNDVNNFDLLLGRMYGEDGTFDKLLNFSKPISHSYWFCPSQKDLGRLFV